MQSCRDLLHAEHSDPSRGEFNRQRDALQPPTDFHYPRRSSRRQGEARRGCACALDKQTHGFGPRERFVRERLSAVDECERAAEILRKVL